MNIKKIKQGNTYIFEHCDRSYDAYHGTSDIDPTKTYLNFNVSENNRHRGDQLLYIKDQTKKNVRADSVSAFALALTLPKPYFGHRDDMDFLHHFFGDAYICIRDFFNLKDSDVASSWVHMDETTPHMHFLGTPLVRDERGTRLYYDGCIPREKYKTYHPVIEDMMREKGWSDIELLNGATRNGNLTVNQLKAKSLAEKNKLVEAEILQRQRELQRLNTDIENLMKLQKSQKKTYSDSLISDFYARYGMEILSFLIQMGNEDRLPEYLKAGILDLNKSNIILQNNIRPIEDFYESKEDREEAKEKETSSLLTSENIEGEKERI